MIVLVPEVHRKYHGAVWNGSAGSSPIYICHFFVPRTKPGCIPDYSTSVNEVLYVGKGITKKTCLFCHQVWVVCNMYKWNTWARANLRKFPCRCFHLLHNMLVYSRLIVALNDPLVVTYWAETQLSNAGRFDLKVCVNCYIIHSLYSSWQRLSCRNILHLSFHWRLCSCSLYGYHWNDICITGLLSSVCTGLFEEQNHSLIRYANSL